MIEQEREPHICYNCDEEFIIHTPFDNAPGVNFCPFCGSEMEDDLDEEEFEFIDIDDEEEF